MPAEFVRATSSARNVDQAPSRVFVARGGIAELTPTILTANDVRDLVKRMLKSSGRHVDLSSPFVDATLSDGYRIHVVIPDISPAYWQVTIRKVIRTVARRATLTCPRQTDAPLRRP